MPNETNRWKFLNNEANITEGLNHAGIETFRGKWVQSLAREVIQNSIDAADGSDKPVIVRFSIRKDVEFGQRQLLDVFKRCQEAAEDLEGDNARKFFHEGTTELKNHRRLSCLVVDDLNTLGLAGRRWDMLLKAEGAGYKDGTSSLGSFGIGKNAAFAASPLRTVLYSTQFTDDIGNPIRKFQGKSVLISHQDNDGTPKRGIGYYGANGWKELTEKGEENDLIPHDMRKLENGTTLYITAFSTQGDWVKDLSKSVVSNYFFAILDRKLEVEISDENGKSQRVTQKNIRSTFRKLATQEKDDQDFQNSYELFRCISTRSGRDGVKKHTTSGQLTHLGYCKIWIQIGEGLPRNVAIIRRPGLLICDGYKLLPGLKSLPSHWSDFSAVVVCESEDGNALLRGMEPPAHNSLEPDRLGDDVGKGEQALEELGRKIRSWLNHEMPKPDLDDTTPINELAHFFPSEESDTNGEDSTKERDPFGNAVVKQPSERIPVVRQPIRPTNQPGFDFDEDGSEDDTESNGNGSRTDEGTNRGRTGTRPTAMARQSRINNVRMRRIAKQIAVGFTPEEDCTATISIAVAAEDRSRSDYLKIISALDNDGREVDINSISLTQGERVNLSVETDPPAPINRALIVEAAVPKAQDE